MLTPQPGASPVPQARRGGPGAPGPCALGPGPRPPPPGDPLAPRGPPVPPHTFSREASMAGAAPRLAASAGPGRLHAGSADEAAAGGAGSAH